MPLRVRLGRVRAFPLPLLALAGVGLLALGQMSQATNRFARVADDNMARLNYIDGVSTALSQMRALELEHLVANDESRRVQTGGKLGAHGAAHEGYTLGLHGRNTLVAGLLVAAGLVFAIGLWFSGYVERRLSSVSMVIRRVAQGDFSSTVPVEGKDEFASLARSFNVMTASLRESEEENAQLHTESLGLR